MAVQKSRKTRSRKAMKYMHQRVLSKPTVSTDKTSGETHRRHHLTPDGFYRGRQVIETPTVTEENE